MNVLPISYRTYNNYSCQTKPSFGAKGVDKVVKTVSKYDSYSFERLYNEVANEFEKASREIPEIFSNGKKFRPQSRSKALFSDVVHKGKKYKINWIPGQMVDHSYELPYFNIFTDTPTERFYVRIHNIRQGEKSYTISH